MNALAATSARRRNTDMLARGLLLAGLLLAMVPLIIVLSYVVIRGAGALSLSFFTTDPTGAFFGDQGGIKSAILGTIETVALATVIAVPTGIALAVYLNEVGRGSKLATLVRYFIDVLTGVPSIVFGLFVYITLVVSGIMGGFAAWKGSVALALLMLPVITRASEVALEVVPNGLREAALALGAPRWRMIVRVVLPTALPGLLTGALLAIARASGETAPLLFTMLGAQVTTFSLSAQMNSLPLQIFNDIRQPNPQLVSRAWGAAFTLIMMILVLNIAARLAARKNSLR
jgi:phosphate transport system permease protein